MLRLLQSTDETELFSTRLKNIEETEKAKRIIAEERNDKRRANDEEAHLSAARCAYILAFTIHGVAERCVFIVYQPNLKAKSDADIIRDAKLAAGAVVLKLHSLRHRSGRWRDGDFLREHFYEVPSSCFGRWRWRSKRWCRGCVFEFLDIRI